MFIDNHSERRQLLSKEEELGDCKRTKNIALTATVLGGLLVSGSAIVSHNPTITNEVVQDMAGIVQSVKSLLGLYLGIDILSFLRFRKREKELSKEIGTNKK